MACDFKKACTQGRRICLSARDVSQLHEPAAKACMHKYGMCTSGKKLLTKEYDINQVMHESVVAVNIA